MRVQLNRADLIGQLLPYLQNTYFNRTSIILRFAFLLSKLYNINIHPPARNQGVERGASPRGFAPAATPR